MKPARKPIQVYFPPEKWEELHKLAERKEVSMSHIVRQATYKEMESGKK